MHDPMSKTTDALSLATERQLDDVCTRFEAVWQVGQRPLIEDYLGQTPEPTRSVFLAELLRLEIDYRTRKGETPSEQEYHARFCQHEVIRDAFAQIPPSSLPCVPGYAIEGELGRGGMGVVYRAWQIKAGRFVAMKMVLAGEMASEGEIERFTTEARAAASLDHPNIVPIYEVGEQNGRHYFTMKLVGGESLAEQVARQPLPSRRAAELVRTIAGAVQYAHEKQVIHRDLKPANVLLDAEGQPHVSDFGLAKRLDGATDRTRTGTVIGTPGYLAPEQAAGRGHQPTAAVDVYGLGAILYALLTGRPPFQAESLLETLAQVVEQPPAPPRLLNPSVDRDLETICLKCLEKVPADRYASAEKVADDLGRYLNNERIEARQLGWGQSLSREFGRQREVVEPLSWSNLSWINAINLLCTHTLVYWLTRIGETPTWFAPVIAVNTLLTGLNLWLCVLRRRTPLSAEERKVTTIYVYFSITASAIYATAYPFRREDVLAIYPVIALLVSLYYLQSARHYWGSLYAHAIFFVVLSIVLKVWADRAPLIFAVAYALQCFLVAVLFRLPRKG